MNIIKKIDLEITKLKTELELKKLERGDLIREIEELMIVPSYLLNNNNKSNVTLELTNIPLDYFISTLITRYICEKYLDM